MSCSGRELERLREEFKDTGYPVSTRAPKEGTYEWVNKRTGEIIEVPKGIGPGWAYNPGKVSLGEEMGRWQA